jgi:glycosyltransferase involved in cell wall biosynthesis
MVKVNILWQFNTVGGGGNQFLNTLKRKLVEKGVYVKNPKDADVLLVNSKDALGRAKKFQGKTIVHRIDGVFSLYRGRGSRPIDLKVYRFAEETADGVIFQSEWSKDAHKKNGMKTHKFETTILNCSDDRCFFKTDSKPKDKIRLITSSWSANMKKGFDIYKYLDDNLDFEKYEYVFAGRSPISFKNIKPIGVLSSSPLANELNASDVFITATQDDTCSNSVIEAISCGLPVVALDSGGTPEIVTQNNGEIFKGKGDVIDKIKLVCEKASSGGYDVKAKSSAEVVEEYYNFMEKVHSEKD